MRIKYTNLLASLMLLMVFSTLNLFAGDLVDEDEIKQKLPMLANGATNVGKEYWFTIPPVYEEGGGANNFIKVFVTSGIQTKVTINIPKIGFSQSQLTIPNDVIVFDLTPSNGQPIGYNAGSRGMSGNPSQTYPGAGINVVADEPILVYVICRYTATSDGFLPIPVSGMGKDYIAAPYAGWIWAGSQLFPAWIGVVAAFDNTKISITTGGSSSTDFELDGGAIKKTGQNIGPITLQKGDVYLISAKGQDPDISGTRIKSTKAVGVVSGQLCTNIPTSNQWCDYTVEMDLPVNTWGTVYHVPAVRGRTFNSIIRIFAKESNTDVFRDGLYWFTLLGGTTNGKGWSERRIWPMREDGPDPYPIKPAVISANKPIGITFYNTGTQEDIGSANSDPFAMVMTPSEQYQKEITFNTPNTKGGQGFADNFVNLIYETDANGLLSDDYEWGQTSGGKFVWQPIGSVFGGTDIKFIGEVNNRKFANKNFRLPADGVYKIRGKKPFAAYSYGFGNYDSYGYPTSVALADLTIPDVDDPDPKWTQECNGDVLDGTITDMPNDPNLRSNLNYVHMVSDNNLSYNYNFRYNPFEAGAAITTSWFLNVIDPLQDARATLLFVDRRGNDTIIVINYSAVKYSITEDKDFGQFQLGESASFDFTLTNLSDTKPLLFKDAKLKSNNQGFTLEALNWDINLPVEPLGTRVLRVTFTADANLPAGKTYFIDSLGIGYECGFKNFVKLEARTGAPTIDVSDWDFKKVNINIGAPRQATGTIRNNGNADLRITSFTGNPVGAITTDLATNSNFVNISVTNPLVIQPGKSIDFNIYFKPTAVQLYTASIVFTANTDKPDNVCKIDGEGIVGDLQTEGFSWPRLRIDRPGFAVNRYAQTGTGTKSLTVTNSASDDVIITNVSVTVKKGKLESFIFTDNSPLNEAELNKRFATKTVAKGGGSITEEVFFLPTEAGEHEIELSFGNSANAECIATFFGIGTEPFITVSPSTNNFTPTGGMIKNNVADKRSETITISNPVNPFGDDLTISTLNANNISNDLNNRSGQGMAYDATLAATQTPIVLSPGTSVDMKVEFVAPNTGIFNGDVSFVSDATLVGTISGTAYSSNNSATFTGEGISQGSDASATNSSVCIGATDPLQVTYNNTGTTPLDVTSVISNNALGTVSFVTATDANFTVAGGGSITIDLVYTPTTAMPATNYTVTFTSNALTDQESIATGIVDSYTFTRSSSSRITGANNNDRVVINENFDYILSLTAGGNDNVSRAGLNKFNIEIVYPGGIVKALYNEPGGLNLSPIFAGKYRIVTPIAVPKIVSGGKKGEMALSLTIEAINAGDVFSGENGDLLSMKFKVFLPAYSKITDDLLGNEVTITHTMTEFTNTECFEFINPVNTVKTIEEICVGNLRNVVVGSTAFSLSGINPNPVNGNGGTINYSVGFDTKTTITLFDIEGNVVTTLVDNNKMPSGVYSVSIPVDKLNSGIYFYQMESGPFKSTEKLVIQK